MRLKRIKIDIEHAAERRELETVASLEEARKAGDKQGIEAYSHALGVLLGTESNRSSATYSENPDVGLAY